MRFVKVRNNDTLLLNGILPVEICHEKWYFTCGNFPWKNIGFTWYLRIWVLPEMYSLNKHFSGNNDILLLNGILPVEIFHRKWHFTSGNFP